MGDWGTSFWQNDTALEVKNDFKRFFKYGLNDDDGIKFVLEHTIPIDDFEDGPIVAMVIAGELWKIGRLTDEWHTKAKNGGEKDLKRWLAEVDDKTYKKREKAITRYLAKLDMPQPEPKKIKRVLPFVNKWVPGDVVAVKNKQKLALFKERGTLLGYYCGGIIVFIIEEIHDGFLSTFVKFDPQINDFSELTYEKISKMQYVLKRFDLHIYGSDEVKDFKYIGNYPDLALRNDVDRNSHTFHTTLNGLSRTLIKFYFEKNEGDWQAQ